jgi:hypothetical protein
MSKKSLALQDQIAKSVQVALGQLDAADAQVVIDMIYVAINFVTLGQSAQMPLFMGLRDVFTKQRGANFFRTSSSFSRRR